MSSFTKQELTEDIDIDIDTDTIIATNESQENGVFNSLSTKEDESIYESVQTYVKCEEIQAIQTESTAAIAHAVWMRSSFRNMDYIDFITIHGQEIFGPTLKRAIDNLYSNWAFLQNSDNLDSLVDATNGVTGRTFSSNMPYSTYTLNEAKQKVKGLLDLEDYNEAKKSIKRLKYKLNDLTEPWSSLASTLFFKEEKKGISFFSKIYFMLR
jgi:hypothetical protein